MILYLLILNAPLEKNGREVTGDNSKYNFVNEKSAVSKSFDIEVCFLRFDLREDIIRFDTGSAPLKSQLAYI